MFEALVSGLQCPMCIDNGSASKAVVAPASDDFVTLYGGAPKSAMAPVQNIVGVKNTSHIAYGTPKKSWVHSSKGTKVNPYPRHY